MSKKEFAQTVLSNVKKERAEAMPDDWRGKLNNWIKC